MALKNKFYNDPFVTVVMTTYNVERYVEGAINSILNQTYQNIELIIVDDCSKDSTIEKIKKYNDPRIKLYRNTINAGTYFCKNFGITQSKGAFIAIQDSDDYSDPNRIALQIKYFNENPEAVICKCNYIRVDENHKPYSEPKAAFQAAMIRKSVYDEIGYYDSVRVAGDDEFDCRARAVYGRPRVAIMPVLLYYNLLRDDSLTHLIKIGGEERITYVESFKAWHEENKSIKKNLYVPFPHVDRKFKAHKKIIPIDLNLTENRFERIKISADKITVSMVSIKARESAFKQVVRDILPQTDQLNIYLNDYEELPTYLNDPKIKVYLGKDWAGDIADNGKFYDLQLLNGFHITIDDDIKYPENYVATLINGLENYNYGVIVGMHGILINYASFKNYYDRNSRIVYTYMHKNVEDRLVHLLGTGTVGYHTNTFRMNFYEANHPRMVDIFFGIQANRAKIPMICLQHEKGWMQDYEVVEESKIFVTHQKSDEIQSKLVLDFPLLTYPPKGMYPVTVATHNFDEQKYSVKVAQLEVANQQKDGQIDVLRTELNEKLEQLDWYGRTYDHLPLPYLKVGAIFRRIKVKKGF